MHLSALSREHAEGILCASSYPICKTGRQ
uniref:Uncharacterized protein n=1 Tax=Anguilla anguilla TaxID=7936 RepID=A0A0E9TG03_ANGAN